MEARPKISLTARSVVLLLVMVLMIALPRVHADDNLQEPEGGWRTLSVDESQNKQRSTIDRILRSRKFSAGEEKFFVEYHHRFALTRWSLPKNRALLSGYRKDLENEFKNGRSGIPYDKLNEIVLSFMSRLAMATPRDEGAPKPRPFHPASRVNAMLMIGELNSVLAKPPTTPPVPVPEALPVMLSAVTDPDQLDAVKVAALAGIVRHATLGGITAAEARKQVADIMLELARRESSAGRSDDGHAWMRSQACEVLGLLESTGDKNEVSTALAEITADTDLPFFLRTAAATSLGKLKYPSGGSFDSTKAAAALGQLIIDVCTAETEAEKLFRDELKAPRDGTGVTHSEEAKIEEFLSRRLRRFKARIVAVDTGLGVLPPKPDAKPSPKELKDIVKAMLRLFDDKDLDKKTLFAQVMELTPVLPKEPAPDEEPEPGPSDIPDDLPDDIPSDLPE